MSEYRNTLRLVKNIDLSGYGLVGEIPREITQLIRLVSLNLSRNNLSGEITSEIGRLKSLDALDLSRNYISGRIPLSFSLLNRPSVLDLSNNNLSGKISTSTQLQSFNANAFMGNPELCGEPLPNKRPEDEPTVPGPGNEKEGEDELISHGFYTSMGIGIVVGFLGVCGIMML